MGTALAVTHQFWPNIRTYASKPIQCSWTHNVFWEAHSAVIRSCDSTSLWDSVTEVSRTSGIHTDGLKANWSRGRHKRLFRRFMWNSESDKNSTLAHKRWEITLKLALFSSVYETSYRKISYGIHPLFSDKVGLLRYDLQTIHAKLWSATELLSSMGTSVHTYMYMLQYLVNEVFVCNRIRNWVLHEFIAAKSFMAEFSFGNRMTNTHFDKCSNGAQQLLQKVTSLLPSLE